MLIHSESRSQVHYSNYCEMFLSINTFSIDTLNYFNCFSGRGYFRRFRSFYPYATIVSVDEKRQRQMQMTKLVDWSFERDRYLVETYDGFCTSTKAIVILEDFELNALNSDIGFKLVVSMEYVSHKKFFQSVTLHKKLQTNLKGTVVLE